MRKFAYLAEHYKDAIEKAGGMPRATETAIIKALHPDQRQHMTRAELDAALDTAGKLFNAWMDSKDRAQRKGR